MARMYRRRRAGRKAPRRARKTRSPLKKTVSALVKRALSRSAEDKWVSVQGNVNFNGSISSAAECYPLCPPVLPGTGDYQRVGASIQAKYLLVRGMVQYKNAELDTASTQFLPPVTCRALILSQKNIKVASDVPTRADVSHLLKDNVATGASRPYSGGMFDNLAPINKDLFRVHMDRKIKFNWVNHQVVLTDTGVSISHNTGNDRTKYFTCKIPLHRTLKFDDGNGNLPNSFAPFFCFGAVCDDGASVWSTAPFIVTWSATLHYEDI